MITIGNKEFRNIQEQVEKNKQDISSLKSEAFVLDEFGIKVVGEVESIEDLPTAEEYESAHEDWAYGDAYAVGTTSPYELYILTRPNETHDTDYWFYIGEFPAPGPQGPAGEDGFSPEISISNIDGGHSVSITDADGTETFNVMDGYNGTNGQNGKSTIYYSGNLSTVIGDYTTITLPNANVNDIVISANGIVGIVTSISDVVIVQTQTSIVGPQGSTGSTGSQGPQGPRGSVIWYYTAVIDANFNTDNDYLYKPSFESEAANNLKVGDWYMANKYISTGQASPAYTTTAVMGQITNIVNNYIYVNILRILTGKQGNPGENGNYIRRTATLNGISEKTYVYKSAIYPAPADSVWRTGDVILSTNGYWGYITRIFDTSIGATNPVELTTDNVEVTTYGALKGADGTNGTNGTNGQDGITPSITAAATVSNTTGTPSVVVTKTGTDAEPTFTFAFSNIKGEPGTTTIGIQVVASLPATGTEGIIYLVPSASASGDDNYDEYIYTNGNWELIGHTAVDLSNYIQKSSTSGLVKNDGTIDTNVYALASALNDYVTATSLSTTLNDYVLASALSTVATSGSYNDLTNTPDLSIYAESANLATVATSGDYDDLIDKPDLSIYAESSDLATVATTGDYDDLLNKPTIPTVNYPVTDVQVDGSSVLDGTVAKITMPTLAAVATSGSYNDLINKPTIPSDMVVIEVSDQTDSGILSANDLSQITTDPIKTLLHRGTVYYNLTGIGTTNIRFTSSNGFTSGATWYTILVNKNNGNWTYEAKTQNYISTYVSDVQVDGSSVVNNGVANITIPTYTQVQSNWNELDSNAASYIQNKPTIPAAQVNSDWNASSGVAEILNKPSLATVATSGSYTDLTNTPTIPDTTNMVTTTTQQDITGLKEFNNDLGIVISAVNSYMPPCITFVNRNDRTKNAKIFVNNSTYGYELPTMNNATATKTIATTDQIPVDLTIIEVSGGSGTLSAADLAKIVANPEKVMILRSNSYYVLSTYDNTTYKYCAARNTTSAIQAFTIAITENSGAWTYSYKTSITSADIDAATKYKNGDTFVTQTYFNAMGYITSGRKEIALSITVPKSLTNVTSITVDKCQCLFRGIAGYVGGSSYIDYASTTGYTVTATKAEDNTITLQIVGTNAFADATNNTVVNAAFNQNSGLQLTFNIA